MLRDPFPRHAVAGRPHVIVRRRLGVALLRRRVRAGRFAAHQPELVLEHRDRRGLAITVGRFRDHLGPLRAVGRAPHIRAAAQLPQGFLMHHQLAITPNAEGRLVEHLRPHHTIFGVPDAALHGPERVLVDDHLAVAIVGRGLVDHRPRHAILGGPQIARQNVALIVAVAEPELSLIHHPLRRVARTESRLGCEILPGWRYAIGLRGACYPARKHRERQGTAKKRNEWDAHVIFAPESCVDKVMTASVSSVKFRGQHKDY